MTVTQEAQGRRAKQPKPRKPKPGRAITDTHPALASVWADYNEYSPDEVSAGSHYQPYWRCDAGRGHEDWFADVCNRVAGSGCPRCFLEPTFEQSVAGVYPLLTLSWGRCNVLSPEEVFAGADCAAFWRCLDDQEHPEWEAKIGNRARGTGCPECWREQQGRPAVGEAVADIHPILIPAWHTENDRTPWDVRPGSQYRAKWRCLPKPHHPDWHATVRSRALGGTGCWPCSFEPDNGQSVGDLYPALLRSWHAGNDRDPFSVSPSAPYLAKWICLDDPDHPDWTASVYSRAIDGSGCAECRWALCVLGTSQAEIDLRTEMSVRWRGCDGPVRLPKANGEGFWRCDIYIESASGPNVVVEYDGEYWHGVGSRRGPSAQAVFDAEKAADLREQGLVVIRVREGSLPVLHADDIQIAKRRRLDAAAVADAIEERVRGLGVELSALDNTDALCQTSDSVPQ